MEFYLVEAGGLGLVYGGSLVEPSTYPLFDVTGVRFQNKRARH